MRTVIVELNNCIIFIFEDGNYALFTQTNYPLMNYTILIEHLLNIHITIITHRLINNHLNF